MKLLLINPNTNTVTTEAMRAIAQDAAPRGVMISAQTAPFGAPLITEPDALARSAQAVLSLLAKGLEPGLSGLIIAAFGDPALHEAQRRMPLPVTGIAEAGMAEAAAAGRRFAVVTTTPDLVESIAQSALTYGHAGQFLGTELAEGDSTALTNDPVRLPQVLLVACQRAIAERGAEAIVIGGGPLAVAAREISHALPVPVIEPVPAAVRLAFARARRQVA
jgi:Asp/Glu/hydantoin racemase